MTLILDLSPEIEATLTEQASRQGVPVADYLTHLISAQVPRKGRGLLPPDQRAAAWEAGIRDLPYTEPLSDEAISRESIYSDRG